TRRGGDGTRAARPRGVGRRYRRARAAGPLVTGRASPRDQGRRAALGAAAGARGLAARRREPRTAGRVARDRAPHAAPRTDAARRRVHAEAQRLVVRERAARAREAHRELRLYRRAAPAPAVEPARDLLRCEAAA